MPHTVFTFLEQVENGMYDHGEFAFEYNGPHVTLATPATDGLKSIFDQSGIAHVLFPEYSPSVAHEPYTVGLAGRPSGPNFYFNMVDNVKLHGPGGYAKDGSGDPCFGKVTRGMDIIDRVHGSTGPLTKGDWKRIENEIVIINMKRF
jgi:cyclophilin family peptidyl-prolyl cis-trans isomerase